MSALESFFLLFLFFFFFRLLCAFMFDRPIINEMGGGAAAATATAAAAAGVAPAAGAGDGRMGLRQTHNLNPNSDSETDNSNGTAKSPSDVSSDDATTSEFSMYSALGRSERFCMGRVVFDLDMLPRNLAESTRRKRNRGGRRRPTVTGERDCNLSHHTEMGNEPNIHNVQSHNATPISESELLEGVFGLSAGGDNVPAGSRANPFSFEEDQYHARGSPLNLSHLSGSKPPITGHTLWTGHSLLSNEADPSGMTDSNRLTEELRVWADRREDGGVFDECGPRKESLSHTLSEPQHGSFEVRVVSLDKSTFKGAF
ncbi:hypothetical protein DFJ73DRAFT_384369 [Zopfochytrium polystomum]|nr:hypothetical protein DFJ73DRAFT_384369 [Zopfochytrium polystomum]